MRTLNRNKQLIRYALLIGEAPIYKLDENGEKIVYRKKSDGTVIYQTTGQNQLVYSDVKSAYVNIAFNSGETSQAEFGIDVGNYDSVIITEKNALPITETSIIWFENEPKYEDEEKTIVDGKSADYKVLQVKPTLNLMKYILERQN